MWNRAAICKLLWCLTLKKDRIWIKWVYEYYIKGADVYDMAVPRQSSWIIRKIIEARDYLKTIQNGRDWIQKSAFSIKDLYKTFVRNPPKQSWAKVLCQNSAPPKYIFILWLLMHGSLATCAYLQKLGIHVDQGCCFCGLELETLNHLFFDCVVTRGIWSGVMKYCGIQRLPGKWCEEREILINHCTTNSGKQRTYRCDVTVLVYHVWMERNRKRMQGTMHEVEKIIQQCKIMLA